MPLRFRFGRRDVEILDQWYGLDYCFFKIEGSNDNLYILRFEQGRAQWELTISRAGGRRLTRLGIGVRLSFHHLSGYP
jgi:hypothetical protein